MFFQNSKWRPLVKLAIAFALAAPVTGWATVARMQTVKGVIDVQLYDKAAPLTVANFLKYVKANAFNNSFFHRSVPGFVIQGGGFTWNNNIAPVTTYAPVKNEYSASRPNVRGTIAMAKLGGNPNSATSQWFFNLNNNGGTPPNGLDYQNGGFTVFGKVLFSGMGVADAIAALPRANLGKNFFGGVFSDLPYMPPVANNTLQKSNIVFVRKVSASAPAATKTEDRVFSYLEGLQPGRFAPANPLSPATGLSKTGSGYYYRYYATTKKYLAAANGKVYWGAALNNTMTQIGTVSGFLTKAAALGY